jgi:hypothetical protein
MADERIDFCEHCGANRLTRCHQTALGWAASSGQARALLSQLVERLETIRASEALRNFYPEWVAELAALLAQAKRELGRPPDRL